VTRETARIDTEQTLIKGQRARRSLPNWHYVGKWTGIICRFDLDTDLPS
jgi:hypothetical protein